MAKKKKSIKATAKPVPMVDDQIALGPLLPNSGAGLGPITPVATRGNQPGTGWTPDGMSREEYEADLRQRLGGPAQPSKGEVIAPEDDGTRSFNENVTEAMKDFPIAGLGLTARSIGNMPAEGIVPAFLGGLKQHGEDLATTGEGIRRVVMGPRKISTQQTPDSAPAVTSQPETGARPYAEPDGEFTGTLAPWADIPAPGESVGLGQITPVQTHSSPSTQARGVQEGSWEDKGIYPSDKPWRMRSGAEINAERLATPEAQRIGITNPNLSEAQKQFLDEARVRQILQSQSNGYTGNTYGGPESNQNFQGEWDHRTGQARTSPAPLVPGGPVPYRYGPGVYREVKGGRVTVGGPMTAQELALAVGAGSRRDRNAFEAKQELLARRMSDQYAREQDIRETGIKARQAADLKKAEYQSQENVAGINARAKQMDNKTRERVAAVNAKVEQLKPGWDAQAKAWLSKHNGTPEAKQFEQAYKIIQAQIDAAKAKIDSDLDPTEDYLAIGKALGVLQQRYGFNLSEKADEKTENAAA